MGCNEEPTSSDDGVSNNNSTNSTLETSNISDIVGSIDEYFHDFDEISAPYIDSKFNRYCCNDSSCSRNGNTRRSNSMLCTQKTKRRT